MSRAIHYTILHHDGAFNAINEQHNGPCWENAIDRAALEAWYKELYGTEGIKELPFELARAINKGTSALSARGLRDSIELWLAVDQRRTVESFIKKYLTIRTTKADPA